MPEQTYYSGSPVSRPPDLRIRRRRFNTRCSWGPSITAKGNGATRRHGVEENIPTTDGM
jgi:hypothetical protein